MPVLDAEDWRSTVFYLLYAQYGGSALQVTYGDLMEMDLTEVLWFFEQLRIMRERESAEISKARG